MTNEVVLLRIMRRNIFSRFGKKVSFQFDGKLTRNKKSKNRFVISRGRFGQAVRIGIDEIPSGPGP